MPQAIAMQLPVTAAAMPTATATPASSLGVTGNAPVFAGLLLRFGRTALASTPAAAGGAIGKDASASGNAVPQSPQPEPAASHTNDQVPLLPEPTLPAAAPSVAASGPAPAAGAPVRPRLAVAVHPGAVQDLAAAATPVAAQDVVAGGTAPSTPMVAASPPASAPETPRQSPADGQARGPRLEGTAAKSGPTVPEPAGTASAPAAPETATSTMAESAAWPTAPVAAMAAQANASQIQPLAAIAQPGSAAAPAPVPETSGAASAPQPDAATAAPAQQVSAALVSLAGAPGGGQRMTLRLEPAELGQVQIRIDRPQDAPAQVDISVQRPETLTLLLRDQPQLQRALDQAGVPPDGRSLTLHIAAPESTASSGGGHASAAAGADSGQGDGNGAGTRSGGQNRSDNAAGPEQDELAAPLPRWLRVGLDITA